MKRHNLLINAALGFLCSFVILPNVANADLIAAKAGNLSSAPTNLVIIDTATAAVVEHIELSTTALTNYRGSQLWVNDAIYVSNKCDIYEVDATTYSLTRTIVVPDGLCTANKHLDDLAFDASTNRLLVSHNEHAQVGTPLVAIDLATGAASALALPPWLNPTAMAVRPGTRQAFVLTWRDGIWVVDIDTGLTIEHFGHGVGGETSTNGTDQIHGGSDLEFADANTLIAQGYGVVKFDVSLIDSGLPPETLWFSADGDGGWGYDTMVTSDGKIFQPGWTSSRVRNSDGTILTGTGLESVNYYYGSAALAPDGVFAVSSGDLAGSGSIGRGVVRLYNEADFTLQGTIDLSATYDYISLRGTPSNPAVAVADADGDGIADEADLCPGTAAGDAVDANGCSDAQLDTDSDGVINNADMCPGTVAGDAVDTNGCSDPQVDADGDGFCDVGGSSGEPSNCTGVDICMGFDDNDDVDGDGIPNGCDDDDNDGPLGDTDADGVNIRPISVLELLMGPR